MPIRLRLALLFAAVTGVLALAGGVVFSRALLFGLENNLDTGLGARAQSIVAGVRAAPAPAGSRPSPLPGSDGIAQVVGTGGRVLAATGAAGDRALMTGAQLARAATGTYVVEVSEALPQPDGSLGEDRLRLLGRPSGRPGEVVLVATSLDTVEDATARTAVQLLVLGAIGVLLAGVGAYLLAGAALGPVERMRARAARLSLTGGGRLPVPSTHDEIARLGTTLNELLARVERTLANERSFVADAGHELRTPLAILKGELELAARPGRSREELQETVTVASEETERLIRLSEALLTLAWADSGPFLQVAAGTDLVEVVRAAVRLAHARAASGEVALRVDGPAQLVLTADPDRLRQVIDNLVANALQAAPPGSTVTVRTASSEGWASIEVSDEGPGFPEDFLPVAFERFRRAGAARPRQEGSTGGTGLGLAVVKAIVAAHAGTVRADNRAPRGGCVTVRLPLGPRPQPAPEPGQLTSGPAGA